MAKILDFYKGKQQVIENEKLGIFITAIPTKQGKHIKKVMDLWNSTHQFKVERKEFNSITIIKAIAISEPESIA